MEHTATRHSKHANMLLRHKPCQSKDLSYNIEVETRERMLSEGALMAWGDFPSTADAPLLRNGNVVYCLSAILD